jgi:hypothetical protein
MPRGRDRKSRQSMQSRSAKEIEAVYIFLIANKT